MPVSREQVRRSIADHLQQRGAQHREAALRATSNDERQRHNRASADLDLAAKHIANQDEAHLDLNELYAWDQAHDQIGEYRWSPNDAQIAAIDAYTEDPTGGLDRLLSELNRLKS